MKSTRLCALAEILFSNESSWTPKTQPTESRAAVWLIFGVQLGLRQTLSLIKIKKIRRGKMPPATLLLSSKLLLSSNLADGTFPLLIVMVLISVCVYLRPSWTPKTQPNGSSAVVWLRFWCSTRLLISTAEKRVKVSTAREIKFSSMSLVEHQKLSPTTGNLPIGRVFGIQLGLQQIL